MSTNIICFSKNRPWQLWQYLSSLRKYCVGTYNVHVIYKATNEAFQEAYEDLRENEIDTYFWEETAAAGGGFNDLLTGVLEAVDAPYILFGVDDLLWVRPFSLPIGENTLKENPKIYSFSYRLGDNISFCHPANSKNILPAKTLDQAVSGYTVKVFDRRQCSGDFNYAWELCGTMYRSIDAKNLITQLREQGMDQTATPNDLEANGSLLINWYENSALNAYQSVPSCSVLTINRVQSKYANPIFDQSAKTPEELLEWYWKGYELDDEWYASQKFNSIHIGALQLKKKD